MKNEMSSVCLQEHWLFHYDSSTMSILYPLHLNSVKCVDDRNPIPPAFRPRGQAGTAFLWSDDIDEFVEVLEDGSHRVQAIKLNIENPIVIINCYMPAEGTHTNDSYSATLDEVHEIMEKYMPSCSIIWLGDINADPTRKTPRSNDRQLIKFCKEKQLTISRRQPNTPTYNSAGKTSRIDLIIIPEDQKSLIRNICIDSENPLNMSPHSAVKVFLTIQLPSTRSQNDVKAQDLQPSIPRIKWHKCDRDKYTKLTEERLTMLYDTTDENTPPSVFMSRINDILYRTSVECCPAPKPRRKKTRYRWEPELYPLMKICKETFWEWKSAGRDKNHNLYRQKQTAKACLRNAQRQIIARDRCTQQQEIMSASQDNMALFYKLINKQRKTPGSKPLVQFTDDLAHPTKSWGNYFSDLATPKDHPTFNEKYERHIEK